jgi:hypothetical protein
MVVQGHFFLPAFLLLDRGLTEVEARDLSTGAGANVDSSRCDFRHRQFLEFRASTLPVRAYLCIARC